EYGVSTSIGYGVSSSLSNTAYSSQLINTAYPPPLDTAYRSSETETEILCMTRSSTNELFTPYKEPEREFRSSRRHFKTLRRRSGSNGGNNGAIHEQDPNGLWIGSHKIDNKDQFELKGQFLKELRENTFSGSDNEDANEHIEKVLKIVDLFHVPNITVDQLMLQVFPISLTRAISHWLRNKPTGSIKTWEDLKTKFLNKYCPPGRTAKKMEEINNFQQEPDETLYQAWERFKELLMKCPQHYLTEMQEVILFYNGLDVPTRQILDSREYSQKWHNGTSRGRSTETSDGLAAIQAQLNNLGREIKKVNEKVYAAQVGCEQCKGPHYTKDCPLKEEGKTLEEAYYTQFGGPTQILRASISVMPLLTYLNLGLGELAHTKLTVELADRTVKYPKRIAKNDNGENIMKSINEGPFYMGTVSDVIAAGTEGAVQQGPIRARVLNDLSAEEKERYKADIRATNILLQGIPKDIYSLINHYTDAKDIWDNVKMILEGSELTKDDRESQLYDEFEHFRQIKGETIHGYYVRFTKLINDMRNIKMTMPRMQLNSKFVNNMLPEWSRFITEVKLNRGLKESNFDQLYAYLKQHEVHANENRTMMERFLQPTNDPLALVSNASVQQYPTQSSKSPQSSNEPSPADNFQLDSGSSSTENLIESLSNSLALLTQSYKSHLPQTNNQLRTSSNARNKATVQDGRVVVQDVRGRYNANNQGKPFQRNNARGNVVVGNVGGQNRGDIINPGLAKPIKLLQDSDYFKDKMLLMQAQENGAVLDKEQSLFLAGEQVTNFDKDVDNSPENDLALNVTFVTSLIHIESRKSPTKSLFDADSIRISIFIVNTYSITRMFWKISQGYYVGLLLTACELDDVQQVFEMECVLTRFRLISWL
ncbi:retrovirus-related pol polyprotein from transposon TNT 1-94, partial [Tanacetum coccineum]